MGGLGPPVHGGDSTADGGGDITRTSEIDQSAFSHLLNADLLAGRNAQRVFEELEWE